MKIILATPLVPPEIGGPATYLKKLVSLLHAEHDLTIVAYASTAEKLPGAQLRTVSKQRPLPLRLIKFFLVLYKEAKNADVIYVQNAVAAGLPAALVGKLRGIPVVLKFVGDEAWERATLYKETTQRLEEFLEHPQGSLYIRLIMWLQGFVLRNVRTVMTPSKYLRDAIVRAYHVAPHKAVVNYNAAEETEAPPFTATPRSFQVVTSARLVSWKGIDGTIRAIALLAPKYPQITFVVAGDGPEEASYKALAKELNVEKHVQFLGRVTRAETWHLRKCSSVYVLNSTYEGLPHTVLTSFAAGIPTVATDIPGTNEAVYDEVSGLLVPPGDTKKLAEAIERLLTDEALRQKVVEGGTKLLLEKFSWRAHTEALLSLFESLALKPSDKV